jgi:8-oxo-dGTP diphosphatase
MTYQYEYPRPMVTATIVPYCWDNFGKLFILVGQRSLKADAFPGDWCLPGGFLDVNNETIEQCAAREFYEETGLPLGIGELKVRRVYSSPDVDPRGHIVNCVFYTHSYINVNFNPGDDIADLAWWDVTSPMKLAFDHNLIVETAIGDINGSW